jgi:hypothetical protein
MILVTQRSPVALLGGHYIYHVDDVQFVTMDPNTRGDRRLEETRYLQYFKQVDLTRNFYYSHSYDLTRSLQNNISNMDGERNSMFTWNHFLLKDAFGEDTVEKMQCNWVLPIVYGFVDQKSISVVHD